MLRLREDQVALLARDVLARQVRAHLERQHAAAIRGLPDHVLEARIALGIRRAGQAGLAWVSAIAGFVALMFTVSPEFDRHPAVRAVLAATGGTLTADERFFALPRKVPPGVWDELHASGDTWPEEPA